MNDKENIYGFTNICDASKLPQRRKSEKTMVLKF